MIQQNVEELYANDIELISRKILSDSKTTQTYASLCEEILSRSEEHTSELQSHVRISYAVFCLKKKKKQNTSSQHQNKKHL